MHGATSVGDLLSWRRHIDLQRVASAVCLLTARG